MARKIRKSPYVTLGKLGEYISSGLRSHSAILRGVKYIDIDDEETRRPVHYYTPAIRGIKEILRSEDHDAAARLIKASLVPLAEDGGYRRQKLEGNEIVLERILTWMSNLPENVTVIPRSGPKSRTCFSGVTLSVMPTFRLSRKRGKKIEYGCVLVYMKRNRPLTAEAAEAMAWLLYTQVQESYGQQNPTPLTLTCIYDVFEDRIWPVPNAKVRCQQTVEAACQQIAAVWPLIPPPRSWNKTAVR